MAKQIEFRDNSKEVISFFDKAKHRALEAIGLAAEGHAKKNCPVDTGRLRNSITYAVSGYSTHVESYRRGNVAGGTKKNTLDMNTEEKKMEGEKDDAVYIGTNVEYATFVENGARGREPIHFLRKAATEHTSEYKKLLEDSMKNA